MRAISTDNPPDPSTAIDVLVVGGGLAGLVAVTTAAREAGVR